MTKTYCDRCEKELAQRPTDFQVCAKIECFSVENESDAFGDTLEFERFDLCGDCVKTIGDLCKEFVKSIKKADAK